MKETDRNKSARRTVSKIGFVFLILFTCQSCAMSYESKARWANAMRQMNESGAWDRPQRQKKPDCTQQYVVYSNGQYRNVQTRNISSDCQD